MYDKFVSKKVRLAWGAFKLTLDVDKPFRTKSNLRYSWDNCIKGLEKMMANLDKFYIPCQYIHKPSCKVFYYIIRRDGVKSYDHSITCHLEVQKEPPRKSYWKMNEWDFNKVEGIVIGFGRTCLNVHLSFQI